MDAAPNYYHGGLDIDIMMPLSHVTTFELVGGMLTTDPCPPGIVDVLPSFIADKSFVTECC